MNKLFYVVNFLKDYQIFYSSIYYCSLCNGLKISKRYFFIQLVINLLLENKTLY